METRLGLAIRKQKDLFIDDDIYEKYKKNEYQEGKIEIYHPYKQGSSIVVNAEEIACIQTKTYKEFYNQYPPM